MYTWRIMLVPSHKRSGFSEKPTEYKTTNKSSPVKVIDSNKSVKGKTKLVKRGPRPNKKAITKNITFTGANIAGARLKWKSWKKIIKDTQASVFFVQETKCEQSDKLKIDGFITFDKVRLDKGGGGVAVAARKELNPVLLR